MSGSERTALQGRQRLTEHLEELKRVLRNTWPEYKTQERWYMARRRHAGVGPGPLTLLPEWTLKRGSKPEKVNGSKGGPHRPGNATAQNADARGASWSEASGRPSRSRSSPWGSGPLLGQPLSSLLTPKSLEPDSWGWQAASGRALPAGAGQKEQYVLSAASDTHRPETSNETSSSGGGGSSGSRNRTSKMAAPSASPPLLQAEGSF